MWGISALLSVENTVQKFNRTKQQTTGARKNVTTAVTRRQTLTLAVTRDIESFVHRDVYAKYVHGNHAGRDGSVTQGRQNISIVDALAATTQLSLGGMTLPFGGHVG